MPAGTPLTFGDFIATLKELFRTLYQLAHDHPSNASPPNAHDGAIGDMRVVDDGTTVKIYVKTARGWFVSTALTAV